MGVKNNPIYVKEEVISELLEKYPSQSEKILKDIDEYTKKFNERPQMAERSEYKIFLHNIKEIVYFEYPQKSKLNEFLKNYESQINKDYLRILKNPHLFRQITEEELDKKIVKEYDTRKTIFLCAQGRLVKNCQVASYNLLVNDEAGTGKDYVTSKTLEIIPKESYIKKSRISPTVFTYWHNSTNEPEWTWDGKVFYTEDISEPVLNSEVFKVMSSSGSQATIVINQKAVDIDIEGKPVMITTTANSTPSPELTRRFEIVNLDESLEQTKEIMKRHCEYAMKGISLEYNENIRKAMSYLRRVEVKIPYAKKLYYLFPPESVIMRTKFPRFLDLIKSSTAFHQFQRKYDKEGFLISEKQDYDIACEVMKKLTSNKYVIPLTKKQKRIIDFFEKKGESYCVSPNKIWGDMNGFMALKNLIINMNQLVSYGILKIKTEEINGRERSNYYLNLDINNSLNRIIFPKFEEL